MRERREPSVVFMCVRAPRQVIEYRLHSSEICAVLTSLGSYDSGIVVGVVQLSVL